MHLFLIFCWFFTLSENHHTAIAIDCNACIIKNNEQFIPKVIGVAARPQATESP
jgi:hypothetical protein